MIYLLYGEEKYDLYKFLENIKNKFGNLELGVNLFNVILDNIDALDNISETVTFLGSNKLVIIKDTKLKFDIKKLNNINDDIYVIIEDTVDKRTSEYKEISKIAEVKEFKHLSANDMAVYLINTLKMYKVFMPKTVAEYMVSVCGEDKGNNINELKKIVSLVKQNDTVTKEIIDSICVKTLNAKIFDMLDLAINKEKDKAIELLDELLLQKEPAIKISIMLYKQIKQMYMIKYLKEKKANNINDILKIHPFVFSKLSKSCEKYTIENLKALIARFDEYDEKTKIGDMDFEIGLKQIICLL